MGLPLSSLACRRYLPMRIRTPAAMARMAMTALGSAMVVMAARPHRIRKMDNSSIPRFLVIFTPNLQCFSYRWLGIGPHYMVNTLPIRPVRRPARWLPAGRVGLTARQCPPQLAPHHEPDGAFLRRAYDLFLARRGAGSFGGTVET